MSVDDTRALVDREWSAFVRLLSAMDQESWACPTRCAGWSVTELVTHVCWGVSMEADALRQSQSAAPRRADGWTAPPDAEPADLVSRLRRSAKSLVDELGALGDADPALLVPLPYGDVQFGSVLDIFGMEAGVHRSDLAHALGYADTLRPDVCRATWAFLAAFLPTLATTAERRPPIGTAYDLIGDTHRLRVRFVGEHWVVADPAEPGESDVAVRGDDSTVLLFALGRRPLDEGLAVRGDPDMAALLKTYVPGP